MAHPKSRSYVGRALPAARIPLIPTIRRAMPAPQQRIRRMKLRPLADRVIVKQSEAETKTASGIVLPDTAKEKPTKGKVIAAGPGKQDDKGKPMALGVK